jgi:hypothetical protein
MNARSALSNDSTVKGNERLSFEQSKIILKRYWEFVKVCEAQRQWRRKFATEPPIR